MGCTGSKPSPAEAEAEKKRQRAQKIVTEVKAARADDKPIDREAALKIQKMFRRTATQKALKFQTNWTVCWCQPRSLLYGTN